MQGTRNACKLPIGGHNDKSAARKHRADRGCLAGAQFEHQVAVRTKQPAGVDRNRAVACKSVGASVEP